MAAQHAQPLHPPPLHPMQLALQAIEAQCGESLKSSGATRREEGGAMRLIKGFVTNKKKGERNMEEVYILKDEITKQTRKKCFLRWNREREKNR